MTVLLLSSSMVCAEWITTGKDYKGDCREMMCDCVEDEAGNGYCCPSGTSLVNTGNSHTTYTPCKCPENQTWDGEKCIGQTICTTLYSNKNKAKENGTCCEPEQKLVQLTANTLFNGYNEAQERYGCCPTDRFYTNTEGQTGCCKTDQRALAVGCCNIDKIYTEGEEEKCCPILESLPKYEEYCNTICGCYPDSGLTCNTTGQCQCPENYGWNSSLNKCLPYCTKNSGVFLLVDRSGSTFDNGGQADVCDSDKDPCKKINRFLDGLDLSDRNYAIYNEETGGCSYNQAMSMLPFGKHSSNDYELWTNVNYQVKCNDSSGTYFDEALKHIESKYCKKDEPIVIMIITDGEVQNDKDKMASSMNNMMGKCNAQVIYIGPNSSTLKKYMNKNVSNFYSYDFSDSVQIWVNATNNAIEGSCIPTDNSDKIFNRSDSSWFCNVLNGGSVKGNSYLHLTKEQCFSCSNTKYREHKSQNKWGNSYVCCGKDNDKGTCKDSQYQWYYK